MSIPNPVTLPETWKQGEHIAVIGDTGTGKTYLISKLVPMRDWVIVLRSKPDDIRFPDFTKAKTAKAMENLYTQRILLDPKYEHQAREGAIMLENVWRQGGWTVVIDELWYVSRLGLGHMVERLLTQGRSKNISVIIGMQRPVEVTRFAISQATHLFSFRLEGRDIKTVKDATTPRIVPVLETLDGHDFAYYNRRDRIVTTGNAKRIQNILTA